MGRRRVLDVFPSLLLLLLSVVSAAPSTAGDSSGSRHPRWATTSLLRAGNHHHHHHHHHSHHHHVSRFSLSSFSASRNSIHSFRNNSVANLTAQLGGTAFLPCRTTYVMERQVREG
ncbi:hypothetical protein O3P69_011134 [Scylla paramamosain]|uniref:Secreted protein n=1 Tax=Scylla paramamosain TaxID=85552 RepID=A0AAW0SW12_SCYPA